MGCGRGRGWRGDDGGGTWAEAAGLALRSRGCSASGGESGGLMYQGDGEEAAICPGDELPLRSPLTSSICGRGRGLDVAWDDPLDQAVLKEEILREIRGCDRSVWRGCLAMQAASCLDKMWTRFLANTQQAEQPWRRGSSRPKSLEGEDQISLVLAYVYQKEVEEIQGAGHVLSEYPLKWTRTRLRIAWQRETKRKYII